MESKNSQGFKLYKEIPLKQEKFFSAPIMLFWNSKEKIISIQCKYDNQYILNMTLTYLKSLSSFFKKSASIDKCLKSLADLIGSNSFRFMEVKDEFLRFLLIIKIEKEEEMIDFRLYNQNTENGKKIFGLISQKKVEKVKKEGDIHEIDDEFHPEGSEKRLIEDKIYKESININPSEIESKEYIEQVAVIGEKLKNQIKYEKKYCKEKFLTVSEKEKKSPEEGGKMFMLGFLQNYLEENGVETVIQKDSLPPYVSQKILEWLSSGYATKQVYQFKYDFGKKRNNEIVNDPLKKEQFISETKKNYSKLFNIPENKIKIFNIRKGCLLEDTDFEDIDYPPEKIREIVANDKNFITTELKTLLGGCKLTPDMLTSEGHRDPKDWPSEGETRGGIPYHPPYGWTGFGLLVKGKYDNGDNTWLEYKDREGVYAVAYHGFCNCDSTALSLVGKIGKTGLRPGSRQLYEKENDKNNPGKKVGKGVYLSPNIEIAEQNASKCSD